MEVYVSNLPYTVDDAELHDVFKEYGKVTRAKVALNPQTGQSRGFGFVTFHERIDAQAAIEGLNGVELHGRKLTVRESVPKGNPDLGGYTPPSQRPGFKGYGDKRR